MYRKTYTRKTKRGNTIRVPGRCIRSQSRYETPLKINRTPMRGYRHTKRALRTCPTGFIKRAAYVRKTKYGKRVHVPEGCIKDTGSPGKGYKYGGPGIGPLRKGELSKYGYKDVANMSTDARHKALDSAILVLGSLGVWRKLNAVAVYTKNTAPHVSKIFKADMDWIKAKYGLKAFE